MLRPLFASSVLLAGSWGAGCDIPPDFPDASIPDFTLVDCTSKKPVDYSNQPTKCLLTQLPIKRALASLEMGFALRVNPDAVSNGGNVLIVKDQRGINPGRRLYVRPYARGSFVRWERRETLTDALEDAFEDFFYKVALKIDQPKSCQELGFQITQGIQLASCTLEATTQYGESEPFIKFAVKSVADNSISRNVDYVFGLRTSTCPPTIEELPFELKSGNSK